LTDIRLCKSGMFRKATNFNQDIGRWNVAKVTFMVTMFNGATNFNQDIGNWKVDEVTDMTTMFNGASSFNQDIGRWNVGKVTSMFQMFAGATSFNQNLCGWTRAARSCENIFLDAGCSFSSDGICSTSGTLVSACQLCDTST